MAQIIVTWPAVSKVISLRTFHASHDALELPRSLFEPARYRGPDGVWYGEFADAIRHQSELEWDAGSLLATLSYGFPLGARTLFRQISRQPWISQFDSEGEPVMLEIPAHGRNWATPAQIAERLLGLLCDEAERVCASYKKVYVLLSGGLDSRIVAGVVKRLCDQGRIDAAVEAVTWGSTDSRDVYFGQLVADALNLRWHHADLTAEHFESNVSQCADRLCAWASPIHLHRMDWFSANAPRDCLVLAGSYGDSVGRSEFSKRTVLELLPIRPFNYLQLLRPSLAAVAACDVQHEIDALHRRSKGQPDYVLFEHEQQCHYMRGLIGQVMDVINHHCRVYQMFTEPAVYGYMWSLHPAARTDYVYAELLKLLDGRLAEIPWARTNRSVSGRKQSSLTHLKPHYHDYATWVRHLIGTQIQSFGENSFFQRFECLDFLDHGRFRDVVQLTMTRAPFRRMEGIKVHGVLAWLMSLQIFVSQLTKVPQTPAMAHAVAPSYASSERRSRLRQYLSGFERVRSNAGVIRRTYLRWKALRKFPVNSQ